jgi:hypothetical protein
MRSWIIAALCTVTLVGCGKSKLDKALSEESDWKDKMCACADKDCTEKVQKDYKEWDKSLKDSITEDDIKNASKDLIEKGDKIEEEMRTCRHKFDKP